LKSGFTAYLSKPVDQHRLHSCLTQFLSPKPAPPDGRLRSQSGGSNNKCIMVVEDSEDALQATCALLRLMGWDPITARDATEALGAVQKYRPAKALVDLNLP